MSRDVQEIRVPAGTIRYREAGSGPVIVFVHGYLVDGQLWDGVVEALSDRYRCIAPDWPLGAHTVAMAPDADLSPPGIATIIEDFLAALDLEDVTLVGNDSGGAMCQVLVARRPARVGRLVLTNCDTHENFPPGIFKAMPPLAKLPGGDAARLPAAPLSAIPAAAASLAGSEFPLLLAWAPGDRFFPIRYAERLAAEVGGAKLVRIPDSATFVPFDQPNRLAAEIADFAPSP